MKLLLIQGANMEYLGRRQPELYGTTTAKELDAIASDVSGVMRSLIESKSVQVRKLGDAVEVQISADILFASGMAEPAPAA